MKSAWTCLGVLGVGSVAMASNLNVTARGAGGGPSMITVVEGTPANYEVFGVLNDTINDGLALFGVDITTDCPGVVLPQTNTPGTAGGPPAALLNFKRNLGIDNPQGFEGTQQNGGLKQCGGGQNTIKNTEGNAPFPVGTVVEDLAQPPTGLVLLAGSFVAPSVPEGQEFIDCHVRLSNLFGNVIKDNESGEPFFKTEAFGVGTITDLTVHIVRVPEDEPILESSIPASCTTANGVGSSLWRSQGNVVRLTFDREIGAERGAQIEINELLPNGMGPNLNTGGNFAFSVEGTGNVTLRIRDMGSNLNHRSWYVIHNHNSGNWGTVAPFAVKLVVQVGDANNDGRVLAADVSLINTGIPCANTTTCADDRRDINGDNRILAIDASAANASIVSTNVNIPMGHACP